MLEDASCDAQEAPSGTLYGPAHTTDQRLQANATLPSRQAALNLIDIFFGQYQVQFPILEKAEFRNMVEEYYSSAIEGDEATPDRRSSTHFLLIMVIAIALIFVSSESDEAVELSKCFAASAMENLASVLKRKELKTLQCLLLLLLYSTLDPSSTPAWSISGICMRMCIDLGLGSEGTLRMSESDGCENDENRKRRLFWISYTFDQTLSVLLGRPFTFEDPSIDVELPSASSTHLKDRQFLHWIKLQRLQNSIVHKLHYESRTAQEAAELSPWTEQMTQRLERWNDRALSLTDSEGHGRDWWSYWYLNALVILHRPPPSQTQLQGSDLLPCYSATRRFIELAFIRESRTLADLTWIDLHYQMMSGITLLFIVRKNAAVRRKVAADWISFRSSVCQWKVILERLAARWETVGLAVEALGKLADATVDLVEKNMSSAAQHDSEATRRERRRKIIAQLRPPQTQTRGAHPLPSPSSAECHSADYPLSTHAGQSTQGYTEEPTQQVAGRQGQYLDQSPSSQGWPPPAGDQYGDPSFNPEYASLSMDMDMSPRLPEDFWPSIGLQPESGIPSDDLAFWAQFSNPAIGAADPALPFVGGTSRQADMSLDDSILNFRGDFTGSEGQEFLI